MIPAAGVDSARHSHGSKLEPSILGTSHDERLIINSEPGVVSVVGVHTFFDIACANDQAGVAAAQELKNSLDFGGPPGPGTGEELGGPPGGIGSQHARRDSPSSAQILPFAQAP